MITISAKRLAALGVVGLSLLATGCGGTTSRAFEIGLKRVAVDLAYTDEAKLPPPVTVTEQQIITAPTPVAVPGFVTTVAPEVIRNDPPRPVVTVPKKVCAKAPADARPLLPVRVLVTDPPKVGGYTTRQVGTFEIKSPLGNFKGKVPAKGGFKLQNLKQSTATDAVGVTTTTFTYDVEELALDGSIVVSSYRTLYTPSNAASNPAGSLELVSQVVKKAGKPDQRFDPQPPITIVAFDKGEGTVWRSAGIDQASGTSMAVLGEIEKREVLDLCGTLIDTYKVLSTERVVNLRTGYQSSTDSAKPNVYWVATQYGGLFIQREFNTTQQSAASTDANNPSSATGAAASLVLSYQALLDTTTPLPLTP